MGCLFQFIAFLVPVQQYFVTELEMLEQLNRATFIGQHETKNITKNITKILPPLLQLVDLDPEEQVAVAALAYLGVTRCHQWTK